MKRFCCLLLILMAVTLSVMSADLLYEPVCDGSQVTYSPSLKTWSIQRETDDSITLTKRAYGGADSYSQYFTFDGSLVITTSSGFEFIKNGILIGVDNNYIKYYKIIYNENNQFEEIPLEASELQDMFPEIEIIRLSQVDDDYKLWIHKPLFKQKKLIFINDSENFYYNLTAKNRRIQDEDFKPLITLSRIGIYNFNHYGKRDGKLILYVR